MRNKTEAKPVKGQARGVLPAMPARRAGGPPERRAGSVRVLQVVS